MAVLAMDRDGKIELAGEIPERIVLGLVQPFAIRQTGLRTDTAPNFSTARRASLTISPTSEPGRTATNFSRLGSALQ